MSGEDFDPNTQEYWEKILAEDPQAQELGIMSHADEGKRPIVTIPEGSPHKGVSRDKLEEGVTTVGSLPDVNKKYERYGEQDRIRYKGTEAPTSYELLITSIMSIVLSEVKDENPLRKVMVHPSCVNGYDSVNLVFADLSVYNIQTLNLEDYDTNKDIHEEFADERDRNAFRIRLSNKIKKLYPHVRFEELSYDPN